MVLGSGPQWWPSAVNGEPMVECPGPVAGAFLHKGTSRVATSHAIEEVTNQARPEQVRRPFWPDDQRLLANDPDPKEADSIRLLSGQYSAKLSERVL
jgi:hypothetical protein